ncbi:MAG: OB-fold nucleic acid binding domain-containing protein [Candidatus Pacearchaeota archaeon]
MTSIGDLKSGQGNVNVEGFIRELGEVRIINKYGRELKLCNAILEDDSGNIKLTLWNDDAVRFKEGDKIKIINGYVGEFKGELQLTSGRLGRMEKITSNIIKNDEEGDLSIIKEEVEDELDSSVTKKGIFSKKDLKKATKEVYEDNSKNIFEENSSDKSIDEEFF